MTEHYRCKAGISETEWQASDLPSLKAPDSMKACALQKAIGSMLQSDIGICCIWQHRDLKIEAPATMDIRPHNIHFSGDSEWQIAQGMDGSGLHAMVALVASHASRRAHTQPG